MTSRLHEDLVRTNLADSVDSFDLGLAHGNSVIITTAACKDQVSPEQVEEAMMATWEKFSHQGPTPAELNRAKQAERRETLSDLASIESRADHISAAWFYFDDPNQINHHLDLIEAVQADEVGDVLTTWTKPENRAVLTYRSQP
jgi:predicted Zn-dependent peptidase